jgi:hypothetical protein
MRNVEIKHILDDSSRLISVRSMSANQTLVDLEVRGSFMFRTVMLAGSFEFHTTYRPTG